MSRTATMLRSALPSPLRERARLTQASVLERRQRRSASVRGAAIVFHSVGHRAGDPEFEIDPPLELGFLDAAVGYLARRYALVCAGELPAAARARRPGEALPIAITFDDDLPSHAELAVPVFQRHGAVATAFLCGQREPLWFQLLQTAIDERGVEPGDLAPVAPALVAAALARLPRAISRLALAIEELSPADRDRVTDALRESMPDGVPVLTSDGVEALVAAGWELGFHTHRHDRLTSLGDDALREAVEPRAVGPGQELPGTLAYPHGKAAAREAAAARDAGYVAAYTGFAHIFAADTDDHLIGRLQPDTSTLGRFALHLARYLAARP